MPGHLNSHPVGDERRSLARGSYCPPFLTRPEVMDRLKREREHTKGTVGDLQMGLADTMTVTWTELRMAKKFRRRPV
jgi:hypothetical protein